MFISTDEIIQTVTMIQQEHLDIRHMNVPGRFVMFCLLRKFFFRTGPSFKWKFIIFV